MRHKLVAKRWRGFLTAHRVNRALTARMEKRALQWMAERAPQWLTSDQLTLLGRRTDWSWNLLCTVAL